MSMKVLLIHRFIVCSLRRLHVAEYTKYTVLCPATVLYNLYFQQLFGRQNILYTQKVRDSNLKLN